MSKRSYLVLSCVALLLVATGCRSTPPQPDENLAEQTLQEAQSSAEEEGSSLAEGSRNDGEEQTPGHERSLDSETPREESEAPGEQVAPHVDARIEAAISRASDGDFPTARATLEGLISEPQGGFLAAYNLAVIEERHGEVGSAEERYLLSLERQPDFTPALTNLIRLYLRSGRVSDAESLANEYVQKRPRNHDHRAARLEVWIAQGRYEDVMEGGRDVLRRDVRHPEAMYYMAVANFRLGRLELAEAILGRAMQLSSNRGEFYLLRAMIALRSENIDLARVHLVRAIELSPDLVEARNHYGVLLLESGNFDRAAEQLENAIEQAPYFVDAWINLGNVYKARGEYSLAEATFKDAIDLDSENGDAHFNLGILYLEAPVPGYEDIPRYELAIESFRRYREVVGARIASAGPVASYISEASAAIEREEARQEQLRRAQMQGGGGSDPVPEEENDNDD